MVPIAGYPLGMELVDVSEVVKDCEFVVFKNALENGGSVRGINAKGQGAMPRKKIDKLVDFAKDFGAKGLCLHCNPGRRYGEIFVRKIYERRRDARIDRGDGWRERRLTSLCC